MYKIMAKEIKITQKQFNEFIDNDGSLVSGGKKNSDRYIKTNQYRDSGRPETGDDFADATGQDLYYWRLRGFTYRI